jgi:cytochrome bd-type quinol oxidase subunit 2
MIHINWFTALVGISAAMVLALHAVLQVADGRDGAAEARARGIADRLYWPVCGLMLALGAAILSIQPGLAETFSLRPELWIVPTIGASGLLGMRFCLRARWNRGSFLCSLVFLGGLVFSATFIYRHFNGSQQYKLTINANAEKNSGGGRSALGSRVATDDSGKRRL